MSSINNGIPFVPENTTDPAAGLNLSINTVDALLQAAVISVAATPPGSPAEGDRHAVDASPTGAWDGQEGTIARYLDGAWSFYPAHVVMSLAVPGWFYWDGSAWQAVGGTQTSSTFELGGDLGVQEMKATRVADQVVVTALSNLTHSSLETAESADGVLPAGFRPSANFLGYVGRSGNIVCEIEVTTSGRVRLRYFDTSSNAAAAGTDSLSLPSVSYNV